jgi:hypothetical protein
VLRSNHSGWRSRRRSRAESRENSTRDSHRSHRPHGARAGVIAQRSRSRPAWRLVEEQLPFADSSDMTEYEGVVHITREPDMDEPPYYGAPHSTYGRFTGHREHEDGSFAEASPVEAWNDVEEAIKWGRTHAPMVVVRLGNTLDTLYSAGEIDAPECRPWPPA